MYRLSIAMIALCVLSTIAFGYEHPNNPQTTDILYMAQQYEVLSPCYTYDGTKGIQSAGVGSNNWLQRKTTITTNLASNDSLYYFNTGTTNNARLQYLVHSPTVDNVNNRSYDVFGYNTLTGSHYVLTVTIPSTSHDSGAGLGNVGTTMSDNITFGSPVSNADCPQTIMQNGNTYNIGYYGYEAWDGLHHWIAYASNTNGTVVACR
jgi:hypothetical protein